MRVGAAPRDQLPAIDCVREMSVGNCRGRRVARQDPSPRIRASQRGKEGRDPSRLDSRQMSDRVEVDHLAQPDETVAHQEVTRRMGREKPGVRRISTTSAGRDPQHRTGTHADQQRQRQPRPPTGPGFGTQPCPHRPHRNPDRHANPSTHQTIVSLSATPGQGAPRGQRLVPASPGDQRLPTDRAHICQVSRTLQRRESATDCSQE